MTSRVPTLYCLVPAFIMAVRQLFSVCLPPDGSPGSFAPIPFYISVSSSEFQSSCHPRPDPDWTLQLTPTVLEQRLHVEPSLSSTWS